MHIGAETPIYIAGPDIFPDIRGANSFTNEDVNIWKRKLNKFAREGAADNLLYAEAVDAFLTVNTLGAPDGDFAQIISEAPQNYGSAIKLNSDELPLPSHMFAPQEGFRNM